MVGTLCQAMKDLKPCLCFVVKSTVIREAMCVTGPEGGSDI